MLQKQLVPIVFGQGIQTKIDSKSQVLGTFRRAVNVLFETINKFKKRNGYDALVLKTLDEVVLQDISLIAKYKNELLAVDTNTLYGYSQSLDRVLERGALYSTTPTSSPILNNSFTHDSYDCTIVNGFSIYIFHDDTNNQVKYSVQDNTSGALIVSNALVGTGELGRVAAINNTVCLLYANGANILYRSFSIFAPQTLTSPVVVANNLETAKPVFDAVGSSTRIFIAYNSSVGAARVRIVSIESDGSVGTGIGLGSSANAISICAKLTSVNQLVVAYTSTTDAYYAIVTFTLGAVTLAQTTLETVAMAVNIDVQEVSVNNFVFTYEISAVEDYNHYIKYNTGTSTGTVGTPAVLKRSVGLAAKSFLVDGSQYIVATYGSDDQATNFILDMQGNVLVKFSPGTAAGICESGVLPNVPSLSATTLLIVSGVKSRLVADNGTFFSLLGVNSTELNFAPEFPLINSFFAENTHFAGGSLRMYDGAVVVEHGFHVYPELPTQGTTSNTGGFMSDGSYGFKAVYRWTDNAGQDHYSAPSETLEVVLSGGPSTQKVEIIVPTLRLTEKQNVVIELYRTEAAGTIYYLETYAYNNTAVDTVTIEATLSDATLISKQLLYTTGGILENIAPASVAVLGVHTAANRLIIVGEKRNQLQFSKIRQEGFPAEFNDALLIDVDPIGGHITAIASMDEKLIIFEETAIFYISGSGPTNTNEQDTYSTPERVSIDTGCINPNSVVLTPMGLMFKSAKGIYLLTRALGLEYVGQGAEDYNALNITSAKLVPDVNQVRYTTSDGNTLVYNYFSQQWGTFDNHIGLSAEVVANTYYYVRTNGQVYKENMQSYSDNTSTISVAVETGWMSFAQLQGFQRVYKLLILGDYKSPHKLKVQIAYDFNEAYTQEVLIDPLDFLEGTTYGEDSPYGSGSPYGGSGNVYQARINLKKQKCQAIKLKISDVQSEAGAGLDLSAITLQVGVKSGTNKVGVSRKFATS